jgi:transketolase
VKSAVDNPSRLATRIRLHAAHMVGIQGFGYLGQALSAAEIFAALYGVIVFRPSMPAMPGTYAPV